jgi:hypothetical protein
MLLFVTRHVADMTKLFIFPLTVTILPNFTSLKKLNLNCEQFPDKETSKNFGMLAKQCVLLPPHQPPQSPFATILH